MFGSHFTTSDGIDVSVNYPGVHNTDSGPDFSGARVKFDGEEWAGNIEIHVKASDWYRHGHDRDVSYDSVILHVVGVDDRSVDRTDGSPIPQICVYPSPDFYNRYASLVTDMDLPGCLPYMFDIPELNRTDWISSLGMERLHGKADYIRDILNGCNGDWQHTLFVAIARGLGFGLNGVPFELLAKSLPLNFVMRHRDNPLQIEALVFGQAGMLIPDEYPYDDYYTLLCREYEFLRHKYGLTPIDPSLWKYSRTRPQNFPHRRLAILASMLASGMQLSTRLIEADGNYEKIVDLFQFEASEYWRKHPKFGMAESRLPLAVTLSSSSIDILIINVAAPFYYAYGSITGNLELAERAQDLLCNIKPERNSVIGVWSNTLLKPTSAFESQALLHLRRDYCQRSRCLDCRFGHLILRKAL